MKATTEPTQPDPPRGRGSVLTRGAVAVAGALGIGVVWWLDRSTGAEIAFSVFYVLPVAFVMWRGGVTLGVTAAVVAAAAWSAAEVEARTYSHPSVHAWNAGVRLAVFLTVGLLVARLRQARDRERALARTDPLTGSANARAFYARLEHEIARSRRTRQPFGLVYFDLDGFKLVNDSEGHLVGDEVLRSVAKRALHELRATDLVARLGGDEFAILLTDTGETGRGRAVEKLQAALLEEMTRHDWPVTFSFGAATFNEPPPDPRRAIQVVDELMYQVKAGGKNGVAHRTVGARQLAGATEDPDDQQP